MKVKEIQLENEELKCKLETNRRLINGLKLNNSKLTLERKELLEENAQLKRELAEIKNMGVWEFARKHCSDEENAEAGHQFAKALLGGGK